MSGAAGTRYDCIVIGGGHNGLTCAAYLARAGRSVLVLEAAGQVGGAAVTREFAPGFRVSACAHLLHLMPGSLMSELGLPAHGLKLAAERMPTVALAPDGAHLTLDDPAGGVPRGCTPADAAAYGAYCEHLQRLAAALAPVLGITPPRLATSAWADRRTLLGLGWRLRTMGRRDMRELLRIGGMCVHDLLEEHFEAPLLKGALAFDAVLGSNYGPRSPGTVFTLLYRLAAAAGEGGGLAQPAGGLGAVSQALAGAAAAAGAEIRMSAGVARIVVRADRAAGVVLESGEEILAGAVVSSADPKTTFLRLLGPEHLDAGFVRRIVHVRSRGLAAKLHVALDGPPQFPGLAATALRSRLLWAPSPEHIERAYNHSKYGEFSAAPMLEITVPTAADAALAPHGSHVISVIAQYAPYTLAAGWTQGREPFTSLLLDTLETLAPGLRARVRHAELLTPTDIEREFRITGGHWHHAELALDQFFMLRPVPGVAQYRAPVEGLYLCGAGCHPGGGVMGIAGRNAARALMKEAA
ncbi:MAG TPA: NAD(P)/FAD-dependent oxidoreductase [Steroidobacteraceae bacterium]|jgi:phytoene dehydrogenase-like protein|nr:NAD(P)/FAD-dependent oxidoreductase [Steroidobacteraceae bacterium]